MSFESGSNRNEIKHHGGAVGTNKNGSRLYASVPMALARDPRISHAARSVAVYVWSHNEKWQQSISAVADALGTDRRTVSAALVSLQEAGWMVRENLGAKRERWHLQMSNEPFSESDIEEILPNVSAEEVVQKMYNPSGGLYKKRTTGCTKNVQQVVQKLPMIVVHEEVHPEVHFSSTSTLSEAAPYGRPLSVVEEQSTTADRTVPCGTGEAAFESAAEQAACWQQQDVQNPTEEPEGAVAPEGEGYRPTGLSQPLVRRKATYSEDTPEGRLLAAIREEGAVSSKSRLDQLMGISWVEVNEVIPRMAEEGIVWHDREHGVLLLN